MLVGEQSVSAKKACAVNAGLVFEFWDLDMRVFVYQIEGVFANGASERKHDEASCISYLSTDNNEFRIEYIDESGNIFTQFSTYFFHDFNAQSIFLVGGIDNVGKGEFAQVFYLIC